MRQSHLITIEFKFSPHANSAAPEMLCEGTVLQKSGGTSAESSLYSRVVSTEGLDAVEIDRAKKDYMLEHILQFCGMKIERRPPTPKRGGIILPPEKKIVR